MAKLVSVDDGYSGAKLVLVEDEEPKKPFGQSVNESVSSIPRQLGLTARYGLEGLGSIPEILGNAMEGIGIKGAGGNFGTTVSDYVGLPKPSNPTERVVADASRMLASGGGFIKGGQLLSKAPGLSGAVGEAFAANPMQQLESAAGAGLLGGYTKETGGDGVSQFLAALAGGVAAPVGIAAASMVPNAAINASKRFVEAVAPGVVNPQQAPEVTVIINNALKNSGLTFDQIPANIQNGIRNDVAEALKQGTNLDANALRRLVDYRLTGAIPRAANLTLDPVALTQQKNLAKLGANSKDPAAQLLARAENDNNTTLIKGLNDLGASIPRDPYAVGANLIDNLDRQNNFAQWGIDNLYGAARNTQGRSAMLDPSFFANRASNLLDDALLGDKIPSAVRERVLNQTALGQTPFTVDVAEQFKTKIAALQRNSADKSERTALGLVRQALDETPLLDNQGQQAIDAFNRARSANKQWMDKVDSVPALKAVRDGIEPDKFVNQFIIGSGDGASVMSVAKLKNMISNDPETMQSVRAMLANQLKSKALNGATDEVGNFSSTAFNNELERIGERKLALFFNADELAQLKAIGRVASYEQVQPRGSAVNNSNTAGTALATLLDRVANSPLLSKIPFGKVLAEPASNAVVGLRSKQAVNVPASLVLPMQKKPMLQGLSPAIGLLGFTE